jgi:regulator of replication initiation timing
MDKTSEIQGIMIEAIARGYKAVIEENRVLVIANKHLVAKFTEVSNENEKVVTDYKNFQAYLREYHPDFMSEYEKRIKKAGG